MIREIALAACKTLAPSEHYSQQNRQRASARGTRISPPHRAHATQPANSNHQQIMRWNPDLLGVVAPFVDLADVGRFAVASRDVDAALRQPDERAAVLAHLGTAEVRAAASLEHAALAEATRAWRPVGSNRRRHNIVIDNDAREVAARCAEVASLLRRHPRATCRVEAHAGADLQPPVLAFALATARARLVRDRLVAWSRRS